MYSVLKIARRVKITLLITNFPGASTKFQEISGISSSNFQTAWYFQDFQGWVSEQFLNGTSAHCRLYSDMKLGEDNTELSMGPHCVTRSNPTHQLTDPTQPTTSRKIWTQPNITNNGAYSSVVRRSAVKSNLTVWCNQILNALTQTFQILVLLL